MKNVLKCYRYLWKSKEAKKDTLNCKIITGVDEEHKQFLHNLQKNPDVISAGREYLYEIDPALMTRFENIKSEVEKK